MATRPITSAPFFAALKQHPESTLVFQTGDTKTNQGYHVTEIKKTKVSSLDCGHGTEEWEELVIQLLDGSASSTAGYMSVSKFLGISGNAIQTGTDQKLYFEFSPGNGPLFKMAANEVSTTGDETVVHLDSLTAECKPFARFIALGRKGSCC